MGKSEVPEGFTIAAMPKLSPDQAFSLIYYLQEVMKIIPDKYEKCWTAGCNNLYDSESEVCIAMLCEACYESRCPRSCDDRNCEECELYRRNQGE